MLNTENVRANIKMDFEEMPPRIFFSTPVNLAQLIYYHCEMFSAVLGHASSFAKIS